MSPAGRTSGEYAMPVSQAQFSDFAGEVRSFIGEQREENRAIRSMLSDGAATMAVLRQDSATFLRRSDDASSKINLLQQKEAVRADREIHEDKKPPPVVTTVTTTTMSPPQTFWDRVKDKLLGYAVLAACLILYDVGREFVIKHPALSSTGDGFTAPKRDAEWRSTHGDAVTTSAPSTSAPPLSPAKP